MAKAQITRGNRGWEVELPSQCPRCHHLIVLGGFSAVCIHMDKAEIVYICPNPDCAMPFVASYSLKDNGQSEVTKLMPRSPKAADISSAIKDISSEFSAIYLEAWEAKEAGLTQICGPGFRKAFEFLIKDYAKRLVGNDSDKRKTIDEAYSGVVVQQHVSDSRIQAVAKRALWLGNNETHYLRKWTNHDVDDLINLIRLTIHWIEIEQLSQQYIAEMPETKGGG